MVQSIFKWFRITYIRMITSIAFIPALVAIFFLFLSYAMVQFDFSEGGKAIKSNAQWLRLKDASTARSVISTITGGIISLTVFSFSMVMILLNQAASQMTNRVLDKLIGNRFQQIVLGFYIGTIVYALFLLSTIRDLDSGIYVPAISTYLLIALTVVDIFLFIYFLHYVTQSVKYDTIIHRVHDATLQSLKKTCTLKSSRDVRVNMQNGIVINAYKSGIYQGFDYEGLVSYCKKQDLIIYFYKTTGTSVIINTPLLRVISKREIPDRLEQDLPVLINIHRGQNIESNYYYGFRQLMEVAVKALSPGINDPGTAVLSLQALGDLLSFLQDHYPVTHVKDDKGEVRIISKQRTFDEIFEECLGSIWDYGKKDRLVQKELFHILTQLDNGNPLIIKMMAVVQKAILNKNFMNFKF